MKGCDSFFNVPEKLGPSSRKPHGISQISQIYGEKEEFPKAWNKYQWHCKYSGENLVHSVGTKYIGSHSKSSVSYLYSFSLSCYVKEKASIWYQHVLLHNTVNSYYFQILYLWVCMHTKVYWQPLSRYSWHFLSPSWICAKQWKIRVNLCTFPAEAKQGDTLPSCFSSHNVKKCPFTVYLVPSFSHFCAFYW